jgi:hypothetical protein
MSAAQSLALLQRLLPGITAREVSAAFAAAFDPGRSIFIAELPAGDGVPDEVEMVTVGRLAVDVKPDKPAEAARAAALMTALPPHGTVVERAEHAAGGVTSLWLDNATIAAWTSARARPRSASRWPGAPSRRRRPTAASPRPRAGPGSARPRAACRAPRSRT